MDAKGSFLSLSVSPLPCSGQFIESEEQEVRVLKFRVGIMTGFVKLRFMYRRAVHNSIGNFLVDSVKLTKGMISLHFCYLRMRTS